MLPIDPWPLVLPATMLGAFGVAVARSRGQWSISLRVAGGARISRGAPMLCPHLGTADDPFSHGDRPSDDHRCYLHMQRSRIDLSHQKGFCLTAAHVGCPWLQIKPDVEPSPLAVRVRAAGRRAAAVAGPAAKQAVAASVRVATRIAGGTRTVTRRAYRWVLDVAAPATGAAAVAELARASRTARFFSDVVSDVMALVAGTTGDAGKRLVTALAWVAAWTAGWVQWLAANAVAMLLQARAALRQRAAAQAARRATTAKPVMRPAIAVRGPVAEASVLDAAVALLPVQLATMTAPAATVAPAVLATPDAPAAAAATTVASVLAAGRAQAGDNLPMDVVAPALTPLVRLRDNLEQPESEGVQFRAGRRSLELGLAAMEAGNEELAYQRFVAATEADPDNRRAWYWRAKTASELPEVIRCLGVILEAEPDNVQVRNSYEWALERLEAEQKRQRLLQRAEVAPSQTPVRLAPVYRENPVGVLLRGLARWSGATACFVLAALWMATALLTVTSDGGGIVPQVLLPFLPDFARIGGEFPELAPGYKMLTWTPHTIAFLALFTGLGLLQQQSWSRPWSLIQALSYLIVVAARGYPSDSLALATALAAAVAAAVVANQYNPSPARENVLFTTTRNLGRG